MPGRDYFVRQAETCRSVARYTGDPDLAERLIELAEDFERRAAEAADEFVASLLQEAEAEPRSH